MARELKKYGLRSTRKPALKTCVSSTVRVVDERGRAGYCYVNFEEALELAIGKRMRSGVATFNPAYLNVEYDMRRGVWKVGARYLATGNGVELWETTVKPGWLNIITIERVENASTENASSSTDSKRSPGARRSPGTTRSSAGAAAGIAVAV